MSVILDIIASLIETKKWTQGELERLPIEKLDKMAFGVNSGDIIHNIHPSRIKIKYPDDLVNPQDKFAKHGMQWAHSVDLSEPVKVDVHTDGHMYLNDGHHRWFAAGKTGRRLSAEIDVKGKPITAILKRQGT